LVVVAGRVSDDVVGGGVVCPAEDWAKTGAAAADRRIARGTVWSNLLCITNYLYERQVYGLMHKPSM
jgi:hypothetical protein